MDISQETAFLDTFERAKGKPRFYLMHDLPEVDVVERLGHELIELMFPGRRGDSMGAISLEAKVHAQLATVETLLFQQFVKAYDYADERGCHADHEARAKDDLTVLFAKLPDIRRLLKLDAQAGYEGDPAASSVREVILSYPFMKAITIHRVAHELYKLGIPLLPRMLAESAHQETGIDIHPGATIGKAFFIDHGTGVVIGETSIIGDHVKLYQGVTLGALSFPKDACGTLIRGTKRHPTIRDHVTIYSHATILGDITIGENAVIGAGVWIRDDVPKNTMVVRDDPKVLLRDLTHHPKEPQDHRFHGLDYAQL